MLKTISSISKGGSSLSFQQNTLFSLALDNMQKLTNRLCEKSTGAVRAMKEILKSSGFKIAKTMNISNTKKMKS